MRRTPRRARLIACALFVTPFALAVEPAPFEAVGPRAASGYLARPRDVRSPRPVTVYLHGLCGGPANGCRHFLDAATERAWLLCPRGPARCGGDTSSWGPSPSAARAAVDRLVDAAERAAPDALDRRAPGVLVGFSQGAYTAERLLRASPGRWRAVAFIAADIRWSRAAFERVGVRRVVLAASRRDMMRPVLQETARRLQAEGFAARFVDLGATGHTYVASGGAAVWRDALAWLEDA
jgi:poly(3-hydroxybutyrate) depolymerase